MLCSLHSLLARLLCPVSHSIDQHVKNGEFTDWAWASIYISNIRLILHFVCFLVQHRNSVDSAPRTQVHRPTHKPNRKTNNWEATQAVSVNQASVVNQASANSVVNQVSAYSVVNQVSVVASSNHNSVPVAARLMPIHSHQTVSSLFEWSYSLRSQFRFVCRRNAKKVIWE